MNQSQVQSAMSNSYIPELDDPKNSRILNRKQIEKRLQNLKPEEYDKICNNLASQNRRLKDEVKELHGRVEELMISKKIGNLNSKRNPLIEEQIKKTKKELNLKYESMLYLKEQVAQMRMTANMTEEMKIEVRNRHNNIKNIEKQIRELTHEKEQLQYIFEENELAMEEYHPKKIDDYDSIANGFREENKALKKKIADILAADKTQEKSSQQSLHKIYQLKSEEQRYLRAILESKSSRKKLNTGSVKTMDLGAGDAASLLNEIEQLKKQKKGAEKELVQEKIMKDQQKAQLEKDIRQHMEQHKQLLRRRMKCLNQLNMYVAKDKKHKDKMLEEEMKADVAMEEKACQTDVIIPKDFRKDWIGKSEGLAFDDSQLLDYRSQIYIKGAMIYKNSEHICCIKLYYESIHKKRYESKIPIEQAIIRKFESKKYMAKGQAFLKEFTVYLLSDKIIKIDLQWSDGETCSEGWDMEGCSRYRVDIGAQERPICMFGSISYQGKNNYALESLGCEINSIDHEIS